MLIFTVSACEPLDLVVSTSTAETPPATAEEPAQPVPTLPAPVMVYPDIPYEQIEGVDLNLLSLDIYAPLAGGPYTPQPAGVRPVMVMIYGGSWREGDKKSSSVAGLKARYFTSHDLIFVSINYRLAPLVKHPAQVQDVAAALAWIHAYIDRYGGDAGQVYVMGHSAGGHLAALVATDESYLGAHSLKPDILRGVILLDAVGLDIPAMVTPATQPMFENAFGTDPAVWREASPLYHVSSGKGIPPFLLFYATIDGKGRTTSQGMAEALTAAGVENWLVAAEGRSHATITEYIGTPGDPVTGRIMEFLEELKP